MSLSRIFSTVPSNLANNIGKVLTVTSSNGISWVTANIEPAFSQANTASANTIYTQGVDATQNTNITYVTNFAQAAFDAANNVFPQIQPAFDVANTASANTIYLQGVDSLQNSRILTTENDIVYLQGALNQANSNLAVANTWLQSNDALTLSVSKTYTDSSNTSLKSYSDNTYLAKTGGTITGSLEIVSNLQVTGNLVVTGNVTSVSANNLNVQDNMIYLNANNYVTNPDLGFAANYNDGTYQHAGFFRDHSTGVWKVFDSYLPEPDASPYIDQSNTSFRIANFQANVGYFGQIQTTSNVLVQGSLVVSSNSHLTVPSGNTAQRPSGTNGMIRYNADTGSFEGYTSTGWGSIGGGSVNMGNTAPSSPKNGDVWWNTDYGRLLIYYTDTDGSQWVDASPNQAGQLAKPVRQSFIAVGGQTNFTVTGGYTPGLVDVFLNGVKLSNGSDVDVSTGTVVTLSTGAIVNSTLDVVGLNSVSLSDVVPTSGGTMVGALNVPTLNVSGTTTSTLFSGSGASLANIPNSALVNTSITINGTTISLGGSGSIIAGATITDDNSTNATRYLMLGTANSGNYTIANTSSTKLTFNPGTGTLTTTGLSSGNTSPISDNTYNLGSPSYRWANVYTADMHFSNENTEGNIVDGTTGNWTLQEGENDIYMLNNKTGKKYRIKLEEV